MRELREGVPVAQRTQSDCSDQYLSTDGEQLFTRLLVICSGKG